MLSAVLRLLVVSIQPSIREDKRWVVLWGLEGRVYHLAVRRLIFNITRSSCSLGIFSIGHGFNWK